MIFYIHFYHFYRSAFMRMVRLLVMLFLGVVLFSNLNTPQSIRLPLFFLSLFIQGELFFHYFVARVGRKVPIEKNTSAILFSCTAEVLHILVGKEKIQSSIPVLLRSQTGKFILQKAHIARAEVPQTDLVTNDVLTFAATIVKKMNGTYITTTDIIAAYLLLIEPHTKLLFNKQLKEEEFLHIVAWARHQYKAEEFPSPKRIHFFGSGIGEGLTTGWTLETKQYTQDFSYRAFQIQPQIIGREKEFTTFLEGLSRKGSNNVMLIGDRGSGKENLVALLAMESFNNTISQGLQHMHILELMIGPLIAGAANRGELETRLQAIIAEVSHAGNVILYIPEFQNILGSSSYNVDLSGALFPYLQNGSLPIIATITHGNYKTYVEKSPLQEAFSTITLTEPDTSTAMLMLQQKSAAIEKKYGVSLTYKAIAAAVTFANRYMQDAALPGSAANLLEDVANKTSATKNGDRNITEDQVVQMVENKTHIAVAAPQGEEKEMLLHLEDKLHERVIDQVDAIKSIAEAMRRLRSGMTSLKRPISFLFLGPTGVGKTETAKALAALYFGGEDTMIRLDMSEYSDEAGVKRLLGAPPGQGEERGELTEKVADRPFSLILLDEFEKAHPSILDLFLQVLEDGRLTDNKGKTVNFINSIIIATSNAGAEFIREEIGKGTAVTKEFSHQLLDQLQKNHIFKPELINRFDDVIIFKPLGQEEMVQIARLMLHEVEGLLKEQDITFTYDDKLIEAIVKEGFDQQFGARPLRRYIQNNVEDVIAQKKLRDEIQRGNTVFMSASTDGSLTCAVT